MDNIKKNDIAIFSKKFRNSNKHIIAKDAISGNPLNKVILNRDLMQKRKKVFSKKIEIESKITNQESSGRCWLFAFLNVLRLKMIKKYNLPGDFEFSQSYLFFWDKFEKANYFLHNMKKLKKESLDNRLVDYLIKYPTSDGGQWNMLVNLVNKYGIIPKSCMVETYHSSNSRELNDLLNNKLRDYAQKIRTNNRFDYKGAMEEIYRMLVIFLGQPPREIVWEYYNKKKKYGKIGPISPLEFYRKYVPFKVDDMVTIVNAPLKSRPYGRLYDIKYFGNMVGGKMTNYVNVKIGEMCDMARKSIKGGDAVFFGSDVGQYFEGHVGVMNQDVYDLERFFGYGIDMDKGQRLEYGISRINHAMILRGYNEVGKKIDRWLVENSWGEKSEYGGE